MATRPVNHLAALVLVLFFVPVKTSVAGISLYLADLAGLVCLGIFGLLLFRTRLKTTAITAAGFVYVFVVYILLSGLLAGAPLPLVMIEMVQWLSVVAVLAVLHNQGFLASSSFLKILTGYIFAASLYTALWHISQGYLIGFKQLGNARYLFGLSCVLVYLLRHKLPYSTLMLAVALALLLMSQERKALLGVVSVVVVDFLFCRQGKTEQDRAAIRLFSAFSLSAVVLVSLSYFYLSDLEQILNKLEFTRFDILFADQQEARWDSDLWRKLLLANGLELFWEHPLLGVGAKMLPAYMPDYFYNQELAIYTHNFALDVAIEYGAVGLLLLFGGFFQALVRLFKQRLSRRVAFLMAVYSLMMVLFVAVNSTIMIIFLLPLFINYQHEPSITPAREAM